jgi:Fe-S oxidoreductase
VIGIEPSEIYTLKDEWFDLLPSRRKSINALAERTWLLEEFLVRPGNDGKNRILRIDNIGEFDIAGERTVLLHGHCYQKAQPPPDDGYPIGQEASAAVLRTLGYEVQIIPSGCCGMAGAFGYESEHFQLSMQVGELELLPAVRKGHSEGAVIVAAGTSCRTQIENGANARAFHPLELLAAGLRS